MKKYFDLYPDVLVMDATYKLNDRCMPLFLMMIVDGNGESQIVAILIIKSENYDIVSKMSKTFKNQNPKHSEIKVLLSDKNFADRRAYSEAFPNARLQLRIFHVLHKENGYYIATTTTKKQVLANMQRSVYASTNIHGVFRFVRRIVHVKFAKGVPIF